MSRARSRHVSGIYRQLDDADFKNISTAPSPSVVAVTPGSASNKAYVYFDSPVVQVPGGAFPTWTFNGSTIVGVASVSADAKTWEFQVGTTVSIGDPWVVVLSTTGQDQFLGLQGGMVQASTGNVVAIANPSTFGITDVKMVDPATITVTFDAPVAVVLSTSIGHFNSWHVASSQVSGINSITDPEHVVMDVGGAPVTSGAAYNFQGNSKTFVSIQGASLRNATGTTSPA